MNDWGIADELTFHQIARGAELKAAGYDLPEDDTIYHASSRQAFIWPNDERGLLKGEHLYEGKTSIEIEEVDPAAAITAERIHAVHRELLAELEAERGPKYWTLDRQPVPERA